MGRKKKEEAADTIELELDEAKLNRLEEIQILRNSKPKMEIKSATLRDGLFCTYAYEQHLSNDISNKTKTTSDLPVHDDLKNAFGKLNVHMAIICEDLLPAEVDLDSLEGVSESAKAIIDSFSATSIKMDGELGSDGVFISGTVKLSTGEILKLETPKINFSNSKYALLSDLTINVYDLIEEVNLYIGGKRAPEVQQDLFDESAAFAEEAL